MLDIAIFIKILVCKTCENVLDFHPRSPPLGPWRYVTVFRGLLGKKVEIMLGEIEELCLGAKSKGYF